MTLLRRARAVLRWILRRDHAERELSAELRTFVDMAAADYERAGLNHDEAQRRARMDLGGVEQARERVRTYRHGGGLDALGRDVRLAARTLVRQPGFTVIVIVTLAIGIGANTAVFSLIDALMLESLPVSRPHELAQVLPTVDGEEDTSLSYPAVRALDGAADAVRGVAGFSGFGFEYGEPGSLRTVRGALVTGAYFDVLGLTPGAGRLLTRQDDEPGAPMVAVISDAFWARELGRRPDVVGTRLRLNGKSVSIVGVAPRGFEGANVGSAEEITMAAGALPQLRPEFAPILGPGVTWMRALARPMPGVDRAIAQERLNAAWPGLVERVAPADWSVERRKSLGATRFRLAPGAAGWSPLRATYRQPLMILMAAVGLLLTIACANVASLLLARAAARQREVAVRLALGAGRWRVVRQMLVESVLVSLAGAAAGVPVAWLADRALVALIANGSTPLSLDVAPDWRVLGFAAGVALVSGLAFGLAPALRATAFDPARGLRDDARTSTSRSKLLPSLVTLQVALSLVLVAGAGLFVRTFDNLRRFDLGFVPDRALVVSLGSTLRDIAAAERIADDVRALPGVVVAGIGNSTPLDGSSWTAAVAPAGQPLPNDDTCRVVAVGPGYFDALGMRVTEGRAIAREDGAGAPPVIMLNARAAAMFFPDRRAIGERMSARLEGGVVVMAVVGVVDAVSDSSLRDDPHATVYVALPQLTTVSPLFLPPALVVRASGPIEPVRRAVQASVQSAQPGRVVTVTRMTDQVGGTISQERVMATLAGTFGALALGLAALGLYGLLSYTVSRRSREIGIRLALGAREGGVVRLVVTYGAGLVAAGVLLGIPVVWAASRWIQSLLFGLTPSDPVAIGATIAALALAAAFATILPARRAARLDPLVVLKRD
jgi:predicted permease